MAVRPHGGSFKIDKLCRRPAPLHHTSDVASSQASRGLSHAGQACPRRRTTSARRLAASCAGPRVVLIFCLCCASCSSSLRIFSSRLQGRRQGRCRGSMPWRRVDEPGPSLPSPVAAHVELVHSLVHGWGRSLLLLFAEEALHSGCERVRESLTAG